MNRDQIMSLIRTLLAAGGPVSGLLVQYGMPADRVNLWLSLALIILPPIAAGIWGILSKTDAATIITASQVQGVDVTVNPQSASTPVLAAALSPTNDVKVTTP